MEFRDQHQRWRGFKEDSRGSVAQPAARLLGMERSVQNSGSEGAGNPLALFATFAVFVEMVVLIVRGENEKTS